MDTPAIVVVTDAGDPAEFTACLTRVAGTVDPQVPVVGVSAHFPRMPHHLAERVDQLRVRHQADVQPAVDSLVAEEPRGRTVVALDARTSVYRGWLESALEHAAHSPHLVLVHGVGAPAMLRLLPSGQHPHRLTSVPVHVAGVREEPARVRVPSQRPADAAREPLTVVRA